MAGRPSICGVTGTGDSHGTGRTPATFARLARILRSPVAPARARVDAARARARQQAVGRAQGTLGAVQRRLPTRTRRVELQPVPGPSCRLQRGCFFQRGWRSKVTGALPLSLLISGAVGVETLIVMTVSNCRPAPASAVAARPLRVATDSRALRPFPQAVSVSLRM